MSGTREENMAGYARLIERKSARLRAERAGIKTGGSDIHPALYDFQRAITMRALELGSCALFEDCGMGKTIQEIEWASHVHTETGKPVHHLRARSRSAIRWWREGERIGVSVEHARHQSDVNGAPVAVTNYEMMRHFDPERFGGLVLDESSSILKNMFGKMRGDIIRFAAPFKIQTRRHRDSSPERSDRDPEPCGLSREDGRPGVTVLVVHAGRWECRSPEVAPEGTRRERLLVLVRNVGDRCTQARRHRPSDAGVRLAGAADDRPRAAFCDQSGRRLCFRSRPASSRSDRKPAGKHRNPDRGVRRAWSTPIPRSGLYGATLNDESSALSPSPFRARSRSADPIQSRRKTRALVDFSEGRVARSRNEAKHRGARTQLAALRTNGFRRSRLQLRSAVSSYPPLLAVRTTSGRSRCIRISTEADRLVIESVARKESGAMDLFDRIPWQLNHGGGAQRSGGSISTPTRHRNRKRVDALPRRFGSDHGRHR